MTYVYSVHLGCVVDLLPALHSRNAVDTLQYINELPFVAMGLLTSLAYRGEPCWH